MTNGVRKMCKHLKHLCYFMLLGTITVFLACSCSQIKNEITAGESVTAVESTTEETTTEESETEREISKRVELGSVLGFENCYAEIEQGAPNYYIWHIFNSEGKEIACQFSYGCDSKPDIVIADIDGDGSDELISNCCYGADGAERAYVFRNRNGAVEVGMIDLEKIQKELGTAFGANEYKVCYSADKNQLVFVNSQDNSERVLSMDDMIFEEYTPDMF